MSASVAVSMISAYERCHGPLHPSAQVAVSARTAHLVKMIHHQTIPSESLWVLVVSLAHQRDEGGRVVIIVEDIGTVISSIEEAVRYPPSDARDVPGARDA